MSDEPRTFEAIWKKLAPWSSQLDFQEAKEIAEAWHQDGRLAGAQEMRARGAAKVRSLCFAETEVPEGQRLNPAYMAWLLEKLPLVPEEGE